MEIFIFGRFHAHAGRENAFAEAMREVVLATREETGCLEVHGIRSVRDPQLFFLHSRWVDQAAFDAHATQPHTVEFLEKLEPLLDQPRDVIRTQVFV